jgi:hypothetical protein
LTRLRPSQRPDQFADSTFGQLLGLRARG